MLLKQVWDIKIDKITFQLGVCKIFFQIFRLNGFKDGTEMKTVSYESNTFVDEMAQTWQGLKPLYEQLHAYVRYHLNKKYGNEIVDPNGPMPAHLLGNMWAQSWGNIAELVKPYPNKPSIDVSEAMKNQGWTPQIMFEKADDFFQSIGFEPMNSKFWKNSIIEKPEDREMVCHASGNLKKNCFYILL